MGLAVSTGKTEITPGAGMETYLGGYGGDGVTFRQATGVFAPLYARCLVLWDDGFPNAIVSVDALDMPRSMHRVIRQRVLALHDFWGSSDFVLATTHTHNGPVLVEKLDPFLAYGLTDLRLVIDYSAALQTQIVNLVRAALAAPRLACTLDYQVIGQHFAVNREGLPYQETDVPILVARRPDGSPAAVLFSYGCHPVSAGIQTLWDGDFPAAACSVVEETLANCFAIYLTGAAGDQDPDGSRDWDRRDELGAGLGSAVAAAAGVPGRALTGPITTSYQEVDLPLAVLDTPENLAAVRMDYQARLDDPGQVPWYRRHAELMIQQIDNHSFATSVPLPSQVWRLRGPPALRLAMVGGELVSGYAVYLRARFGGSDGVVVTGYTNETPLYVASDELLPPLRTGGSYGGGWDSDFPGIGGGSMTVYGYLAHLRAGLGGAEKVLTAALVAQLGLT